MRDAVFSQFSSASDQDASKLRMLLLKARVAILVWCISIPIMMIPGPEYKMEVRLIAVAVALVVVVLCLVAYSSRAYFDQDQELRFPSEFDDIPDRAMSNDETAKEEEWTAIKANMKTQTQGKEENMLLTLVGIMLCAAGCSCSLAGATGLAVHCVLAPRALDCSTADLQKLAQQGYTKFSCHGGYGDLAGEVGILEAVVSFHPAISSHYLVPVYAHHTSGQRTPPVALAIGMGKIPQQTSCGGGLCGFIVNQGGNHSFDKFFVPSESDRNAYMHLRGVLEKKLEHGGVRGFDVDKLPMVILASSLLPGNELLRSLWSFLLYVAASGGLVFYYSQLSREDKSRRDAFTVAKFSRMEQLEPDVFLGVRHTAIS